MTNQLLIFPPDTVRYFLVIQAQKTKDERGIDGGTTQGIMALPWVHNGIAMKVAWSKNGLYKKKTVTNYKPIVFNLLVLDGCLPGF